MTKHTVVGNTFDMDENLVCMAPRQPRASGEKRVLLQIKVQVKSQKVNSLFDSGSHCNMISKTLVDELGLETYDLVHPSSLVWLQGKSIMRVTCRCKIKFVNNDSYVDKECEVVSLDACEIMFSNPYL